MSKKILPLLLLVGLFFRLSIVTIDYRGDVNNHIAWGKDTVENGFTRFYDREYFPEKYGTLNANYPPFAILSFYFSEIAYKWSKEAIFYLSAHVDGFSTNFVNAFDNPKLLPAFYKLPAILSDIGIAYIIYLFALAINTSRRRAIVAASLVLFNPAFFYNSALWGQIEAVPLFFVLAGLYTLIVGDNRYRSLLFYTVAILSKQTALIFLPVFVFGYFKKYPIKESVKSFCAALILFIIVFIPFGSLNTFFLFEPFVIYWTKILTVSGLANASSHAFNLWGLITNYAPVPDTEIFWYGYSYRYWGLSLAAFFSLAIIIRLTRWGWHSKQIVSASFLIGLSVFLFATQMSERHLLQTLPLLLILVLYNWQRLPTYVFLSIFSFANLYHGWWVPQLPLLENILSATVTINFLSISVILIFLFEIAIYLFLKDNSG